MSMPEINLSVIDWPCASTDNGRWHPQFVYFCTPFSSVAWPVGSKHSWTKKMFMLGCAVNSTSCASESVRFDFSFQTQRNQTKENSCEAFTTTWTPHKKIHTKILSANNFAKELRHISNTHRLQAAKKEPILSAKKEGMNLIWMARALVVVDMWSVRLA